MKRQQTLEEEKTTRQSRRELSADQNTLRNQIGLDPSSRRGTITNETLGGQNFQTRKKVIEDEETENLIEKCMLSQPNKYTVDQIKKQHAFVWSFGQNTKGELGVGHYNEVLMPERVRGLPRMKILHLSSGAKHTGAVSEDGKLWMCGSNLHDKLGLEGITTGSKKTFKPVELLYSVKIKQVACGDYHTLALTNDGQVYAWGGSLHNKRGDRSEERKGTAKHKPVLLKTLENKRITQIDCGDFHSLALENNGTLYSWGVGQKGECGHGKFEDAEIPMRIKFFDGKPIVLVEAGNHHTLALTKDGEIYAWGDGRYGQCGYGEYENTSIPQIINFQTQNENQTLLDDSSQQDLFDFFKEPPKIKQIAAGEMHSLVLTTNGQVFSFGYNSQGQLGHNNTENYCRPKLVEGMITHKVVQIAAGRNHSLALTTKNDVYACGSGQQGQLGLPDRDIRKTFMHVLSLMSVNSVKLYAGGFHSWAVLDEMMPKKDEFQALKGTNSNDDDSLLNSNEDYNQFNSHLDLGGKSYISNSNYYHDQLKHSRYIIQLNYTDTGLSHRFIRFELSEQNLEQGKTKVEEYIRSIYKDEAGTIYHKLQEDQDITGDKGQILSGATGKFGKFFTLQIVSDITKNDDTVEQKRELVKNNFDFIDEIYDLFIRHAFGVVGHQPQKTSIGLQVLLREQDVNQSEYEKKLCSWAAQFSKAMTGLASADIQHPINEDIIQDIKQKTKSWVPHDTDENPLKDYSHEELHMILGTKLRPALGTMTPQMENVDLPLNFDAREKWPNCVHSIRNQQKCGSCWAFAASEAFSDRMCIASKESLNEVFSPESLLECDKSDFGCNGGELQTVWKYLEHDGIVLDKCEPYISGEGQVPQCTMKCTDPNVGFQRFHCKEGSVVEAVNREMIKEQIYLYGPMETGFEVYQDFFNYKNGVYHHVSGGLAGGHAVKVLGWGQEEGLDYWLCANSWGPEWGEQGFFKIKMGEGGIDQSVWSCEPDSLKQLNTPVFY